jgi:hypothetical protein
MVSEFLEPGAVAAAGTAASYLTYKYLKGSHNAGMALAEADTDKVTEMELDYAEFVQEVDDGSFTGTVKNFLGSSGEAAYQLGAQSSIGRKGELLRQRDYLLEGMQRELWDEETTVGEYNHALAEGYEEIL